VKRAALEYALVCLSILSLAAALSGGGGCELARPEGRAWYHSATNGAAGGQP